MPEGETVTPPAAAPKGKGVRAYVRAHWKELLALVLAAIPLLFFIFHKPTQAAVSQIAFPPAGSGSGGGGGGDGSSSSGPATGTTPTPVVNVDPLYQLLGITAPLKAGADTWSNNLVGYFSKSTDTLASIAARYYVDPKQAAQAQQWFEFYKLDASGNPIADPTFNPGDLVVIPELSGYRITPAGSKYISVNGSNPGPSPSVGQKPMSTRMNPKVLGKP